MTLTTRQKTGHVILVGAGCGRGLCTLAGLDAIRSAESLVYDDLIDPALLAQCPESAVRIYVGKRSGRHSMTQDEINAVLISEARAGRNVVRLKGGDSFVFGRGGEEILALQEAGILYDIIPGVTSSVAVPEHLGLPVTHRGLARSFTVITGHTKDDSSENWQALAALDGTLVFLMGVERLGQICASLIEHGKASDTPAAILFRGYGTGEGRIDGTLADLPEKAAGRLLTPGIIVVGPTAAMHLERTLRRPLEGCRVTVCGSPRFIQICRERLEREGAQTDTRESIRIAPDPGNIPPVEEMKAYDWLVFTSRNGIAVFFDEMRRRRQDMRTLAHMKVACIGSGTADELAERGIYADFIPSDYTALALGRELPSVLKKEDRVLILRAENGSPMLSRELETAGVSYEDRAIYHTVPVSGDATDAGYVGTGDLGSELPMARKADKTNKSDERDENSIDADKSARGQHATDEYIVFASSGGVDAYLKDRDIPKSARIVCIGEYTAQRLGEHGYTQPLIAHPHTAEGITQCILEDISKRRA